MWRAVSLELAWEPVGAIVVDGAEVIVARVSLSVVVIGAVDDPEDDVDGLSLLLVELSSEDDVEGLSLLLVEVVKELRVPDEEIEFEVLEICTSVVLEAVPDANEEVLLLLERTLDELVRVTPVLISTEEESSVGAVLTGVEVLEAG